MNSKNKNIQVIANIDLEGVLGNNFVEVIDHSISEAANLEVLKKPQMSLVLKP
jgi:hypothetical protein